MLPIEVNLNKIVSYLREIWPTCLCHSLIPLLITAGFLFTIHHGLLWRPQVSRLIPLHYWKEHGGWARPSWSRVCKCLSDQSDGLLHSMPTKLPLYLLQLFEIFQPG